MRPASCCLLPLAQHRRPSTTAFSMRCLPSSHESPRIAIGAAGLRMSMISRLCSALLLAFLLLPLGAAGQARADEPRFTRIEPVIHDGKLQIDAEVDFQLNDQLRDAAERGLPLYFTAADRKSTRLNSSHSCALRMPYSA